MISDFENYLRLQTDLSEDEITHISVLAVPRKLRRNEFLLHEGEVCRYKTFVVGGLLRTFGLTPDGLIVEKQPSLKVFHAVAEQGVPFGQIAEAIGQGLNLPVVSVRAARPLRNILDGLPILPALAARR